MKWVLLVAVGALIGLLCFVQARDSCTHTYVSPNGKHAVVIKSRPLFALEKTRRLNIRVIDTADGKVIGKVRHDVKTGFLYWFLKDPDPDQCLYKVEWIYDDLVHVTFPECTHVFIL